MRKEPIVFLIAAGLVGVVAFRALGRADGRGVTSRGETPELVRHAAPDVARYLPRADERLIARDPFVPPSNTRPLPPLELQALPLPRAWALFPPADFAPAPRLWSRLLAVVPEVREVPELFAAAVEASAGGAQAEAAELLAQFGALSSGAGVDANTDLRGVVRSDKSDGKASETPEERAARLESYRTLYDWIQVNEYDPLFGAIRNRDRLGLNHADRAGEPIQFEELDPATGTPRMPGAKPIDYDRARVRSFGFADTVANRLDLRRHALGARLSRSLYLQALDLADDCVAARLDAPRALSIAEELYRSLAELDPEDPAPRLGLGRCYEAGFDFERALATYEDLARQFDHRALPHVRLAGLYERFLLFEKAEAELDLALARERSSYEVQWARGRYFLARGRERDALAALELAARFAPDDPDRKSERVAIRIDYGRALVANGELAAARDVLRTAVAAESANQPALVGWISAVMLEGGDVAKALADAQSLGSAAAAWLAGGGAANAALPNAEPELLLLAGLLDLRAGRFTEARDQFVRARGADPLREAAALCATSWLAEICGATEEAWSSIENAYLADPSDAWVLYQRGRLARARDDAQAAEAMLQAALGREIDCEAVLVELGRLCHDQGRYAEADRYYDQALRLSPKRASSHVLRGVAALEAGDLGAARKAFDAALALDPNEPTAAAGVAWCIYRSGNPKEALIQLRALDDRRRALPETDPWRAWAIAQVKRIADHLDKTLWTDRFDRTTLKNNWTSDEGAGPIVAMLDGTVKIEGQFKEPGQVRVFQTFKSASQFVSIEASVFIAPGSQARVGLFVAREKERAKGRELTAEARVSRHSEGQLQVRFIKAGEAEAPESDIVGTPFPLGKWVRLRIEIGGEEGQPTVTVLVDGVPVRENVAMPQLGRASTELRAGVFVEGEVGRSALVQLDDCDVVYRTGGS
ncbi:MAG: tetratricopeptide repeat protein [Planctomycetota bacterium]|nr:MAG: tetratricopeptide repeat protein [Planctomycetota bacterium]